MTKMKEIGKMSNRMIQLRDEKQQLASEIGTLKFKIDRLKQRLWLFRIFVSNRIFKLKLELELKEGKLKLVDKEFSLELDSLINKKK